MLSPKTWNPESVCRLLAVLFLGLAVVGLMSHLADRALVGESNETRRLLVSVAGTVLFQIVALFLVGWFLREHRTNWSEAFGLRRRGVGRMALLGVGTTLGVFPVSLGLMLVSQKAMTWLSLKVVAQQPVQALQSANSLEQKILLGVMAIVLAPVVEEIVFRGILYPAVKDLGYPRLALGLTVAVFAFIHFNVLTFLPLVFFAIVLTVLYESTDCLLAPIFTHSLFNTANFVWLVAGGQSF